MKKPSSSNALSVERKLTYSDQELMRALCGERNVNLQLVEKKIGLSINIRGNILLLKGFDWEVDLAEKVLNQLYGLLKAKYPLYPDDVLDALRILSDDPSANLAEIPVPAPAPMIGIPSTMFLRSRAKASSRAINGIFYKPPTRRTKSIFVLLVGRNAIPSLPTLGKLKAHPTPCRTKLLFVHLVGQNCFLSSL